MEKQWQRQLRFSLVILDAFFLFFFIIDISFTCVSRPEEGGRPFPLHACLVSPDSELAFLRCVARILLLCLLPQNDVKSHTLRCCLTEVITTKGTKVCVCFKNFLSTF